MDIKENVKVIIFKIFIIIFSLCTLLWLSIFSYGILYYLYIPAVAHIKPVHLQYDMSCFKKEMCKNPFDNITLIEGEKEFLRGGQGYAIELALEMPESERNLNQGMFMVKLDMTELHGRVVKSSCRPAMLRYRSPLFKVIFTLFIIPGLLAGSLEEKQSLVVPLFEKYIEDSRNPAHFAYVEIQARTAEIYSSTLRIHAQFTGLRYLMYYWPVTSAIIGVGSNFLFLVVTMGLIWLRETMKVPTDDPQNLWQTQNIRKETRKQPKKRPKSVGFSRDKTPERKADIAGRIKKERIEIETLPTYSAPDRKENDDNDEDYFDAELFDTSRSPNVTSNVGDFQSSSIKQRIKLILGKKESD